MAFVVGVVLAVAVAALAKVTRFDEDHSFYCIVLIIIAPVPGSEIADALALLRSRA